MMSSLRSVWIWTLMISLIGIWVPFLAVIRLFDRDPAHMRTGLWFRRLGKAMVQVNSAWRVHISGKENAEPGHAYVVLSNHMSQADIPLISCLPWEMKWLAKKELFTVPFVGWMMRMAGDIPVDRGRRTGMQALNQAKKYLQQNCSVMVFPEGTRSPDGLVHAFSDGAFHLAVKAQVPVLPLVVEGSQACLPKGSWKFGDPQDVFLKVLPPVDTTGMTTRDVMALRERVRQMIVEQIAELRGVRPEAVATPSDPAAA